MKFKIIPSQLINKLEKNRKYLWFVHKDSDIELNKLLNITESMANITLFDHKEIDSDLERFVERVERKIDKSFITHLKDVWKKNITCKNEDRALDDFKRYIDSIDETNKRLIADAFYEGLLN